ncbi:Solute carrier organic anion transporter family member 2A1 [Triplophysa tibetana]|uniref:Solute carrier organic anion transporter family member 2A1 n=1 Tax=Triplophysa tibetana TaxID=1572043 RepID=A0A5A9NUB3_9TELE|nr:Solute carrier organic anion transporter family member 2A1 [Triplophysa tibetana]
MYSAYLKSTITTIERRFGLDSLSSGTISSLHEVGNTVFIVFISYMGSRVHRPRFIGLGGLLMSISAMILALPHFLLEPYTFDSVLHASRQDMCYLQTNATGAKACGREDSQKLADTSKFWGLIALAQLLFGIGSVPIQPFGISYIDDFAGPGNSPLYIAILFAVSVFGPSFGYLLGSVVLRIYVDVDRADTGGGSSAGGANHLSRGVPGGKVGSAFLPAWRDNGTHLSAGVVPYRPIRAVAVKVRARSCPPWGLPVIVPSREKVADGVEVSPSTSVGAQEPEPMSKGSWVSGKQTSRGISEASRRPRGALELSPSDPRWVGAWWMGLLITAGALALTSIPYFFFPRSLHVEKIFNPDAEIMKDAHNKTESSMLDFLKRTCVFCDVNQRARCPAARARSPHCVLWLSPAHVEEALFESNCPHYEDHPVWVLMVRRLAALRDFARQGPAPPPGEIKSWTAF